MPWQTEAVVEILPVIEGVNFGPHGLKVMSSKARSLPQPPGALLKILNTMSDTLEGVVKKKPNCCHTGLDCDGISPLL